MEEVNYFKIVRKAGGTGMISLPKFLVGSEVKITFMRKLTEEEKKRLKLNQLMSELNKLREIRKKKETKKHTPQKSKQNKVEK